MFHAWPVKIIRIDASSRPTLLPGKIRASARTTPGMKPRTGMLCRMSSSGMRIRCATGSFAAQKPYVSVNASEQTYASSPRESE